MKNNRMVKGVFFFFLLAVCLPYTAGAVDKTDFNYESTQDLHDVCSVDPDDPNYIPAILACRAFIEAAVQYHDAVTDSKNLKRLICYGKDATIEKGRVAFLAWFEKHKDDKKLMEELPVIGLVRALADKYPCSK
jgi:hypothetical protein